MQDLPEHYYSDSESDYEDDIDDDEQVEINIRIPLHKLDEFEDLLAILMEDLGIITENHLEH